MINHKIRISNKMMDTGMQPASITNGTGCLVLKLFHDKQLILIFDDKITLLDWF